MKRFPVASDGWRFIAPLAAVTLVLFSLDHVLAKALAGVFSLATLFCLYFFRDFDRQTVIDPTLIYSPGDGCVVAAETVLEGEFKGLLIVRIFLSVFDGHVQRSPVSGTVTRVVYKKGLFLDARHPEAHVRNEQNLVYIETPQGPVVVNQIAGLIARRIVCWIQEKKELAQGERYGLIRFGSQVDVILPSSTKIKVKPGQRVVSGETVLAQWS